MIRSAFFLLLFIITSNQVLLADIKQTDVSFYSEKVSISYNTAMFYTAAYRPEIVNTRTNKSQLQEFYETLGKKDYQTLLNNLKVLKDSFQLNDWLYYDLMKKSVDVIFRNYTKTHRTIINWLLLSKSGYDARITYQDEDFYLNVYVEEELFEVPIIKEGGKSLVNLTNLHDNGMAMNRLYMASFIPNEFGKPMSFDLSLLPKLSAEVIKKKVEFESDENLYEFELKFDKTLVNLMRNYPFFAEYKYLEVPFSPTLEKSLIPIFRQILQGRSWKEQLQILVSFTRTGFEYKTDEEVYGKSKPMIAEEIFHYQYSDCEDRSALFYSLVKILLKYPMIIIAYEDHITVGVATPSSIGQAYLYEGNRYYVCDPTGPEGSYEIGFVPEGYEKQAFEVITAFHGRILSLVDRLNPKQMVIQYSPSSPF